MNLLHNMKTIFRVNNHPTFFQAIERLLETKETNFVWLIHPKVLE
jgi:hypothetical protein